MKVIRLALDGPFVSYGPLALQVSVTVYQLEIKLFFIALYSMENSYHLIQLTFSNFDNENILQRLKEPEHF